MKTNKFVEIETHGGDWFTGEHNIKIFHNKYIDVIQSYWTFNWNVFPIKERKLKDVIKGIKYMNELVAIYKRISGEDW